MLRRLLVLLVITIGTVVTVAATSTTTASAATSTYDAPALARAYAHHNADATALSEAGESGLGVLREWPARLTVGARGASTNPPALGNAPQRALPAARQVDAPWGPAYDYRHGTGPMTAIEHVNYRHAFDSGFENVSRFSQGTSARQIQTYVDDAMRYGNVTQNGASITYDVGRTIGLDQAGNAVSGIQVWVRDGYIRTAYPVALP